MRPARRALPHMALHSHNRRLAVLLACACLGSAVAATETSANSGPNARPAAAKKISKKERAKIRKQLAREVKRDPSIFFKENFAKRAALVDFKLPLTVRLDTLDGQGGYLPSDDQLEVDYDDSTAPWPLAGGAMPAPQTTFLTGQFTMEASFGGDASGYGEPGALETVQGTQTT